MRVISADTSWPEEGLHGGVCVALEQGKALVLLAWGPPLIRKHKGELVLEPFEIACQCRHILQTPFGGVGAATCSS